MADLADLRTAAYRYLAAAHTRAVKTNWRLILGDTDGLTDIGPVCSDPQHPGYPDIGIDRDETGLYDCCPPVLETFSEPLAAYLVALLNADSDRITPERAESPTTVERQVVVTGAVWAPLSDWLGSHRLELRPRASDSETYDIRRAEPKES